MPKKKKGGKKKKSKKVKLIGNETPDQVRCKHRHLHGYSLKLCGLVETPGAAMDAINGLVCF